MHYKLGCIWSCKKCKRLSRQKHKRYFRFLTVYLSSPHIEPVPTPCRLHISDCNQNSAITGIQKLQPSCAYEYTYMWNVQYIATGKHCSSILWYSMQLAMIHFLHICSLLQSTLHILQFCISLLYYLGDTCRSLNPFIPNKPWKSLMSTVSGWP